jgi:hypothetical protein
LQSKTREAKFKRCGTRAATLANNLPAHWPHSVERFLTELLAANSRRLLNTIVEWDADGATLSGKVFQIIANPANLETAVIAAGTACHVVPVAQLRIPGGKP